MRRHLWRSVARVATQLVGDGVAYLVARELVRGIRDHAIFGQALATSCKGECHG